MFPELPVSLPWTNALLSDIPRNRYKSIRDIDREVKHAKTKVDEYARKRPDLFQYGTDFVTKSLTFVDSQFRAVHSTSPETLKAASEAGITRY
jgi:hypothetical protein